MACSSLGHHQPTWPFWTNFQGYPHPHPQSAMPGAQPGEWKVSWISAPTCPLSQVFLRRAQPAQPTALVASRLCLCVAV